MVGHRLALEQHDLEAAQPVGQLVAQGRAEPREQTLGAVVIPADKVQLQLMLHQLQREIDDRLPAIGLRPGGGIVEAEPSAGEATEQRRLAGVELVGDPLPGPAHAVAHDRALLPARLEEEVKVLAAEAGPRREAEDLQVLAELRQEEAGDAVPSHALVARPAPDVGPPCQQGLLDDAPPLRVPGKLRTVQVVDHLHLDGEQSHAGHQDRGVDPTPVAAGHERTVDLAEQREPEQQPPAGGQRAGRASLQE